MTTERRDETAAPQRSDTPIVELVDGLAEIGAQAIPYGRLPARARSVYAAEFSTWSDLADQTIESLIARPGGGAVTVRAILAAARDAVARARSTPPAGSGDAASAARRLLDRLTERDRIILSSRKWALRPQNADDVARLLGVSDATAWRSATAAEARLAELLADPVHRDVMTHAERLRARLGPLVRDHTISAVLGELGLDPSGAAGLMLLHLAGPYTWRDTWWQDISTDGLSTASAVLDAAFTRSGAPSTAALAGELGRIGMPAALAVDFIESRPGLRRFGDKWVRWGARAADMAEAVLHVLGAPATAEMIAAEIGGDCSPRAVRGALYLEHRFIRTTRRSWALRQWGLDEYAGVFGEIAKRIDAAGGTLSVEAVSADVQASFPDVATISIRTYLRSAPGFVIEDAMVRRRTAADGWPAAPPAHATRGVFFNGRNEVRLALPVTRDLLRGSGQHLQPAVGAALGITPGQRRRFSGAQGDITLTWLLSTTHGPNAGSLRPLAAAVGATRDDTLVLAFDVRRSAVTAARIKPGEDPHPRLQTLLGRPARDPIRGLARALRCQPGEVASILRERGDHEILGLLAQGG